MFSISTATNTILKEARLSYPRAIAVTPNGTVAFIMDGPPGGTGTGTVESITTANNQYHVGFGVGITSVAMTIVP